MTATHNSLVSDLRRLGVAPDDVLMVHASLRTLGSVKGGASVVMQSLLDAIGPGGTLVAYVDFEPFYEDEDEDDIPVFDKRIACAARDHGVLHETMRTWPGALRSDHPDAGVVAIGPLADWLTRDHPFQYGYGAHSPFAKFVEVKGRVLLLGAPLDTITLLHYAEHLADIPDKRIRRYRRLMPGPKWVEFEEFDTSDPVHPSLPANCFELITEEYLAMGRGRQRFVGAGRGYLFDGDDLAQFGVQWIERFVGQATRI